jgi:Nif-specific regulatory protein
MVAKDLNRSVGSSLLIVADPVWVEATDTNREAPELLRFWSECVLQSSDGGLVSPSDFFQHRLLDLAAEFSATWTGIFRWDVTWSTIAEWGRRPPQSGLEGSWESLRSHVGVARCGLQGKAAQQTLWLVGQSESAENSVSDWMLVVLVPGNATEIPIADLSNRLAAWRASLRILQRRQHDTEHLRRLREILRVSAELVALPDLVSGLRHLAESATAILDCERASLFIWDRESRELMACPALGVDGEVLRIPEDRGIAGECVRTRRVVQVDDVTLDSRFDSRVDEATGYHTRNLLCVPLVSRTGELVGAFEVLNRRAGRFDELDVEALQELGRYALVSLDSVRERERLLRRQRLQSEDDGGAIQLIGASPAIAALRQTVERLAQTDLPVLVQGESGTGKEVVAQALHARGPRSSQPFIAVNCGALPENLLESELFGHEKGAFTDAREARPGKFELADGGTLFLDELAELSLAGQVKLLRVLEQREICRVGGNRVIRVDVRIVAATNRQLARAVKEQRFREDLYYRLAVVTVDLPPLRDRPADVLPLAEHFLERFARQAGRRGMHFSPAAQGRLQSHAWPGNVRELRNLMERVAFLAPAPEVAPEDLAFLVGPAQDSSVDATDLGLSEATDQFQIGFIRRMIQRVNGNMTEAAGRLGLHRSNLYRKMRSLGMDEHRAETGL